jgi:hypothetical protein
VAPQPAQVQALSAETTTSSGRSREGSRGMGRFLRSLRGHPRTGLDRNRLGAYGPDMASRRRRRRPQGHPARIAQRRKRGSGRRVEPRADLQHIARAACDEAAQLSTALDAELWASRILGSWWPGPDGFVSEGAELALGEPLVEVIARMGGEGALAALLALGEVSETELGLLALKRAERLAEAGVARPDWAGAICEAEILRAAVMRETVFDDGATIFLEARHAGGEPHAIGVYIDNNLGVMAKDILLADSIDAVKSVVRDHPADEGDVRLEPIALAQAAARLRAALELTDMTLAAPVGEDYAALRSLALLRVDELPYAEVEIDRPGLDTGERERVLAEFLDSPEADGIDGGSEPADVVSMAIDFCADYVDGRPLRWSPVVVELFMADWLPRKVLADEAYFLAVPRALDAWIRYAGRLRGLPSWAVERTLEAVAEWTDPMLRTARNGERHGPAAAFLAAAQEAGVDLSDEGALASFVAGWNARSPAA